MRNLFSAENAAQTKSLASDFFRCYRVWGLGLVRLFLVLSAMLAENECSDLVEMRVALHCQSAQRKH